MGQPGDGVALAAAGRVLDQVATAYAVGACVGQQAAHYVELDGSAARFGSASSCPFSRPSILLLGRSSLGYWSGSRGGALPATGSRLPARWGWAGCQRRRSSLG